MGLIQCSSCNRHVRAEDKSCPFCGTRSGSSMLAAAAAAAALALAGCGSKAPASSQPPGNEGSDTAVIDAGVDQPPPDDDYDRGGGDVQPLYGVDLDRE